ncbi:proteasome lid subunit RPN8/RPN11 [Pseudomonas sp. JUb42]|nr:proteasome lid subunit RPN8/RPN11 [Pseudomonas sp. JUb42]
MNNTLLKQIQRHAAEQYPKECCGVIIEENGTQQYVPCHNDATTPSEHFIINPHDKAAAEDRGEILTIVHSHPDVLPQPSMADRVSCELHELPWCIVSWPSGEYFEFAPSGYQAPLIGREFAHGLLDCYALCRDFYWREWGLELPNFPRRDGWWKTGESLYERYYQQAGFYPVTEPQYGDMLVMQIDAQAPNHAGVFLGDVGLNTEPGLHPVKYSFIHHRYNKKSSRDVYGGMWADCTRLMLRHKSVSEVR